MPTEASSWSDTAPIETVIGPVVVRFYPGFRKLNLTRSAAVGKKIVVRERITFDLEKLSKSERKNLADAIAFALTTERSDLDEPTEDDEE